MFPLLNTQHVLALDELLTHVSSGGELVLFERVTWFVRSGRGGGVYNREMFLLAQWVVDCVPHKNAIYSTLLSTTTAPAPEWLQTGHIISFAVTKKQNIPAIFLYRFYKKWTDEKDRGDGKALASHGNKQELVHMCETSCIQVKSDLFPTPFISENLIISCLFCKVSWQENHNPTTMNWFNSVKL